MGHGCDAGGTSLDTAHICIRSVEETFEATNAINVCRSALSVHARVRALVVVEADLLSCRSSEDGALRGSHLSVDGIDSATLLLREEGKSSAELIKRDPPRSSLLDLAEGQVDVRGRHLLVEKLGVFGAFGESLAVHGGLSGPTVVIEDLLELLG